MVRSPFAHARVVRLDPEARARASRRRRRLTGADVAALSRPFPAGIDSPVPYYAAAHETVALRGRARRRRRRAQPLPRRGRPSSSSRSTTSRSTPVLDPEAAAGRHACVSDRSFHYGDVDAALAALTSSSRETFRFPRFSCTPVECYGVVADWNERRGFARRPGPISRARSRCTASPRPHSGSPAPSSACSRRPTRAARSAIKSSVFAYVVLMGLASRKLGVPVRWIEDRLEHLAASSAATGRVTEVEAGFTSDGELLALRYDAIEDVAPTSARPSRPRSTGCTARSPARTESGTSPRGTESSSRTRCPTRAQSRLRRPAALPRARADDGDRGRPARARPGRAPAAQLDCGRRVPVPDAFWRPLRLRRLRGLSRRRARARPLRRAACGGGRRARRGKARRDRARLRRRAVGLEHGLHHARRAGQRREGYRSRGTPKAARSRSPPLGGITVRLATTPRARATVPLPPRSSPTSSASSLRTSRCSPRWTLRPRRGRSPPGTTRRASRASAQARSALAAEKVAAKIAAIREHLGGRRAALAPAHRGNRALEPGSAAAGNRARTHRHCLLRGSEPLPAGRRRPRCLLGGTWLRGRRRRRRSGARDRAGSPSVTT